MEIVCAGDPFSPKAAYGYVERVSDGLQKFLGLFLFRAWIAATREGQLAAERSVLLNHLADANRRVDSSALFADRVAAHATATGATFFPSHAHAGGYVALLRKAE